MDRKLGGVTTAVLAVAVAAVIVFMTTPSAEQAIAAVGKRSCATYSTARADASRTPPVDGPYPDLASYAYFVSPHDPGALNGPAGDRLDNFCRINPGKTFSEAVNAIR